MNANAHYDAIIIGSGAGGSAAAYRLTQRGFRVLLLEKGRPLPVDGSTLDLDKVIRQGFFKSREPWLDRNGMTFVPEEYFNLGGKTKWYGAALLRFGSDEFDADEAHQCLPWPIGYNDCFPHSSIQPLGFDGELIAALLPRFVPQRFGRLLGQRTYGFFLQTEDGSHPDNRVLARGNGSQYPQLDYDPARLTPAVAEHRRLVRAFRRALLGAGLLGMAEPIPLSGTAHACGTLVTGGDPATSVVDGYGRVHGLKNLYVVDGSILPRSSRANPSLTIYAWALRVADQLQPRGLIQ